MKNLNTFFKEIWVLPALDYIECTQKQNNGKLTKH